MSDEPVIQLPKGWVLDVENLGWSAWAHTPDGAYGLREYGSTKEEAVKRLEDRLKDWQIRDTTRPHRIVRAAPDG